MPSGPHKRAALRRKKQQQQQQQQPDRCHAKSGAVQDDAGSAEEEEEEEEEQLVSPGTPATDRDSPVAPPLPSPLPEKDQGAETAEWVPDSTPSPSDGTNQEEKEHIQMLLEHTTVTEEEDKRQKEEEEEQQPQQENGRQVDLLLKPQPAAGCSCGILDWLLGRA